jgi:hypothetical protein
MATLDKPVLFGVPMTKSNYFGGVGRLRSMSFAGLLLVAGCLGFGPVLAEGESKSDSVQDSAKTIEKGFGELLKGMGREIGKIIGSEGAAKKEEKRKAKPAEKESKTDKETK